MNLRISQLASAADVNVETVRYYERRGLLEKPVKPRQGWRVYGDDALRRIRFIKRAQGLGFSLDEISELLSLHARRNPGACEQAVHATRAKIEEIDGKIAELTGMRNELGSLVATCQRTGPSASCAILEAFDGAQATAQLDAVVTG